MSYPAGLLSQTDFTARWMPSGAPDLAESLRHHAPAWGAPSRDPDDSFASDFAPLPASTNSSCISVGALAQRLECGSELGDLNQRPAGPGPVMSNKPFAGLHCEVDSLEELVSQSQDRSLIMKLDQLRQWQQQMQEQLKARQLEELLRLQEEQQRMMGMMNGSDLTGTACTERSGLSGTDWEESTLGADSPHRESPHLHTLPSQPGPHQDPVSPPAQRHVQPGPHRDPVSPPARRHVQPGPRQDPTPHPTRRHGQPHRGLDRKEQDEEADTWSSDEDEQDEEVVLVGPVCEDQDATPETRAAEPEDLPLQERPIRPGIGGRKQTFEELLEEQLKLEELKTTQQQQQQQHQQQQNQDETEEAGAPPKRSFLKRGEGLSRFTKSHKASLPNREAKQDPKPQPSARVGSCRSSEPKSTLKTNVGSGQRPPVQRKTAVLNKENRPKDLRSPPSDIRAESRTAAPKALGSHRRESLGGADCVQTDPQGRHQQHQPGPPALKDTTARRPGVSVQAAGGPPNAVTRRAGAAEGGAAVRASVACGSMVPPPGYSSSGLPLQEKMRRWTSDRQQESMELGEFELLELAAEELSFSSNSSFVMKVLQMDEQHRRVQAALGRHSRRLSSTPIKSPGPSPPQARSKSVSSDSEAPKMGDDGLVNEVGGDAAEEEDGKAFDDVSFRSGSAFGDQEAAAAGVDPATFPSDHCFSASNGPYDRRSYQDRDGHGEAALDLTDGEDSQSDGGLLLTGPEDSTLTEDDRRGRLVFDDDDTWNDPEDEAVGGQAEGSSVGAAPVVCVAAVGSSGSPPERALTRKVAAGRGLASDWGGGVVCSANQEPDPPPPATSHLMAKLFPSLKPKAQTAPPASAPSVPSVPSVPSAPSATSAPSAPSDPRKDEEAPGQQVQSRQLRERLVELELEIERFRKENAVLTKLRQENEKNQESLRKERLEFEQRKAEELARFEEHKREETRRLQKERKVFEKYASAARAVPDKREREEIQALKQQLSSLQEELRRRESRWSTTHSRLRQQIEALSADNGSLKGEVGTLEKLRLAAWRTSQSEGEKDKKEGPRMLDSGSASAAKGVKFASPLDTRRRSCPPIKVCPGETAAAAAGIKSSLRKSSIAGSSSSAAPPVTRTLDKPPTQDPAHNPPLNRECLQMEVKEPDTNQEVITHPDGKMERVLPCGGRLIVFPNGTRKELSADGQTAKVIFFNGDTKQVMADQRVMYYYADAQTSHTTYPDGMEVLQFPSNQTEKHFPDGRKEITFPDQTMKTLYPDGREESVLTDGTIIQVNSDGSKEIQFNTGQKEVHTAEYKRREYPDGTVKTVYTDGRQETHYPTGRIRVKDKDGNVVMDKV